eukprot:TRINITY_DN194_c0_g1_i1.p1 TRINITY_DN194_c0_g1~~TRINITY_DN194_c0_g1_i1.p1  ORF type:complete len:393 (+),score=104.58 TRINITY_DN194_c0_g1_i1:38-1216(+)
MKALFLVGLAAVAFATPTAINAKYGAAANGVCTATTGYEINAYRTLPGTFGSPDSAPIADGSSCAFAAEETGTIMCADGYKSDSATTGIQANVNGTITGVPATFVEEDVTTSTTLTCVKVGCNYTCTTSNDTTNAGCMSASGQADVGTSSTDICNAGYFPNAVTTCPANGTTNTSAFVCSNSAADCPADQYLACATAIGGAFAVPTACNCDPTQAIVCATENDNSPTCTGCSLSCTLATATRRQNPYTAASGAICPSSADTIAEAHDCFEQAACAGAISKDTHTCVYGGDLECNTDVCPECPSSSKKGLLGLLGLLGLIPLLLCSLLCSLLLCCIRRRKVERDVHFATFDAGAPSVAAPVCTEMPMMASCAPAPFQSTFVGHDMMPAVPTHY